MIARRILVPQRLRRGLITQGLLLPNAALSRLSPTPTLLTDGASSVDGTSIATASITPVADQVVYAVINSIRVGGTDLPTCTGNNLTWELVDTIQNSSLARRLTVFRAQGPAPTAGALTFGFGSQTQESFIWAVVQFANAKATGANGSDATRQAVKAEVNTQPSMTMTLAPLEHPNNVHFCATAIGSSGFAHDNDADFTELSERNITSTASRMGTQWARNQTDCTTTFNDPTGPATVMAISIEVRAG